MPNAIIYARYSDRPNASDCESIQTQTERICSYCDCNGLVILEKFQDEAISGARADNRPGLQAAVKAACSQGAALVVYSLSRLARSTKDAIEIAERLDRAGADLISLSEQIDTTTAMGKFVFRLMAGLAELERELVAERTRDAMRRHQANGRRMSDRTPYGWVRDPVNSALLIEEPAEQDVIRRICSLREQGQGLRGICRTLETQGIGCRGGRWHHQTVSSVLRRMGAI